MGKDPDKYVKLPDGWGYGENIYPTHLDHMHQLHCLDYLRKLLHREYYNKTTDTDIGHGDHCVRSLFDYLACHPTWEVTNYIWMEKRPRPWPDFVSLRQCRDMQPLLDFDAANSVDTDARVRYLVPSENAYIHQQDPATQDFLDTVYQHHPNFPKVDEETKLRTKQFNKAMSEWEATGEIPRVDGMFSW